MTTDQITAQADAWSQSCRNHYVTGGYMAVAHLLMGEWVVGEALTLWQAIDWHAHDRRYEAIRHVFEKPAGRSHRRNVYHGQRRRSGIC